MTEIETLEKHLSYFINLLSNDKFDKQQLDTEKGVFNVHRNFDFLGAVIQNKEQKEILEKFCKGLEFELLNSHKFNSDTYIMLYRRNYENMLKKANAPTEKAKSLGIDMNRNELLSIEKEQLRQVYQSDTKAFQNVINNEILQFNCKLQKEGIATYSESWKNAMQRNFGLQFCKENFKFYFP